MPANFGIGTLAGRRRLPPVRIAHADPAVAHLLVVRHRIVHRGLESEAARLLSLRENHSAKIGSRIATAANTLGVPTRSTANANAATPAVWPR